MLVNHVEVEETFAEAFPMQAARLIITADREAWALQAAEVFCGYATSVIGCDVEAGIERLLTDSDTPDHRPGVSVLAFAFRRESLEKALQNRVGQCVLTCATTACYDGLPDAPSEKRVKLGSALRFFGDGYQKSKKLGSRRFWRIPVMDGEFTCEDRVGTVKGVAGGNLLLCGENPRQTLETAELVVRAIRNLPDVILPFPGGLVRSGSKVGARYAALKASTNDSYCPVLQGLGNTRLPKGCRAVYEIVMDGLSLDAVRHAMQVGLMVAIKQPGLLRITAGNYGGKLGPYHLSLAELLTSPQQGIPTLGE